MRILKAACLAIAMATASAPAPAQVSSEIYEDTPSAGAMAVDLLVVRPVSLVGSVLGLGLFVIDLPFSVLRGEPPKESAQRFVVEPLRYTFARDLGRMTLDD